MFVRVTFTAIQQEEDNGAYRRDIFHYGILSDLQFYRRPGKRTSILFVRSTGQLILFSILS